jgi:hypothetical protein
MRSSAKRSHEEGSANAICTLKLPSSAIQSVFPGVSLKVRGPGGQVTAVVRKLLLDLSSLFGLPAPMRKLLEQDRAAQGITTNTQYLQWLVLQRAAELAKSATGGSS